MDITTTHTNKKSSSYWFKDYQEIHEKQNNTLSLSYNLSTNYFDNYDIPPCQANLITHSGCFSSLISPDFN
jgi:hypothetical protein